MARPAPNTEVELLSLPEREWWQYKASFCKDLYRRGLEYPPWTDECAQWWFQSILLFVGEFIRPEFPIPDFHKDWYWWSVRESAYMNLSPRDHAKTTVHSVIRVVWEICVNRNVTFFITLATTDVAKLILSQIKGHLTQNPRIKAGFGNFNPQELDPSERLVDQDWSQTSITVNRDNFDLKDPTVAVAGALSNVLSRRTHRLIVDDVLTDKIAFSEAESERLNRWYFNDVQPILRADGQEIITGTRYRKGDFYGTIERLSLDSDGVYRVFVGDAIIDEVEGKVLWPERWPYKALQRQRMKMGTVRFNRNYRNRITSDQDSPFPMVWFEGGLDKVTGAYYSGCYDYDLILGSPPKSEKHGLSFITVGVDPAIGTSYSAKYFALVVLGLDVFRKLVIVDIIREKLTFPAQKRTVIDVNRKYNPRYIAVESNVYQKALVEGIDEMTLIPVVPYYTRKNAKISTETGIPSMDVYFETSKVRIPRGNDDSIMMTDKLVEELHYWGKAETSDVAMALWFAFERMKPLLRAYNLLPKAENTIFGDRVRYERQRMVGLSGQALPRLALQMIREKAQNAPLEHLSPLRRR